jgi:hypothetical protein
VPDRSGSVLPIQGRTLVNAARSAAALMARQATSARIPVLQLAGHIFSLSRRALIAAIIVHVLADDLLSDRSRMPSWQSPLAPSQFGSKLDSVLAPSSWPPVAQWHPAIISMPGDVRCGQMAICGPCPSYPSSSGSPPSTASSTRRRIAPCARSCAPSFCPAYPTSLPSSGFAGLPSR